MTLKGGGGELVKALGAVAPLQQKGFTAPSSGQMGLEAARFARKDKRRIF